jgi:hypothetical protein
VKECEMLCLGVLKGGEKNEEDEGGWICMLCFVYSYENRTMMLVEIVLWRRRRESGKMIEGVNLTKVNYKHIWKCQNESFLYD